MGKTKAEKKFEKEEERNIQKTALIVELISAGVAVLVGRLCRGCGRGRSG